MMTRRFGDSKPVFPINGLVLVGVCAAGKSTLSRLLLDVGIPAKPVAQEHSMVRHLYRHGGSRPVVVLVANWETVHRRRKMSWDPEFYRTEWLRIREARGEAGLILHTDTLTPDGVCQAIRDWYDQHFGLVQMWESPRWDKAWDRAVTRFEAAGGGSGLRDKIASDFQGMEARYREALSRAEL